MTPSSTRKTEVPGSPWRTTTSPADSRPIVGLAAPCISCTDRVRSSAVSTAVTSAGESSSPHGLCLPNDLAVQSAKSVRPDLWLSWPSAPYTQCRGNVLAPVMAGSAVPSACTVSVRVVHTSGASHCM